MINKKKDKDEINFKDKFKNIIQNISSVMIPMMLIANISMDRLAISILPSIISLLFLGYDYYCSLTKVKKIDESYRKFQVNVKEKSTLNSWYINQMYIDIEYFIDQKVMIKGMKSSIIDRNKFIKTIGNNYSDYHYNFKIPEEQYIDFTYKGNKMSVYKVVTERSGDGTLSNKSIYVMSDKFENIKLFLDECQNIYREYILDLTKSTYNFYRYDTSNNKWISKKLKTIKNYNNVILSAELEEQLKNWISSFNESKKEYEMKGIPYKLGLLFHGIPGCGKTSLTYAIAYETKRNIYQIPIDDFISGDKLKTIIENIPEGNIILFEEVDTCSFFRKRKLRDNNNTKKPKKIDNPIETGISIVKVKNKIDDTKENDSDDESEDESDNNSNKKKTVNKSNNDDNDKPEAQTSALLEILDGYNYLHDAIVIMYTNHLDRLDDAIIRPGRIDHKIELSYANSHQVKKTYILFYNKELDDDLCQEIANKKITTSYLINTCILPYFNDVKKSIETVLKYNPNENNDDINDVEEKSDNGDIPDDIEICKN